MDSKARGGAARRGKSAGKSRRNLGSKTSNPKPSPSASEPMDPQKAALWEKEKQKLEKKYDSQRRALEKDRKKIETERKAVEKKRLKFLKEKSENDRLKILLSAEKEIWLNRKRKNNDGHALLAQVTAKTKEWEERQEKAKGEWDSIEKKRAEMKEQHSSIAAEREKLKADLQQLEEDKKEFEAKSQTLVEITNTNEENKARLSELEDQLKQGENGVEERRMEYEGKDTLMKKRELIVSQKDARLKKERALMEDLKKNVYSTLQQRRTEFITQSKELSSEIKNWNSSFTQLFSGIGQRAEEAKSSDDTYVNDPNPSEHSLSRESFRGVTI